VSRRRRRRHSSRRLRTTDNDESASASESSSSTDAHSSRASTSSISADIVRVDVATRPPGSEPKPPFAIRSAVPPAPAPTMRADELEQISHAEMLKVRLHSPRDGAAAPLQSSKSMISPRALAAARSASVRPLEAAPMPPSQGSIVKLVKPKHVAPSPPSSASPQPSSPPVASVRSPRSPRRKSTRGHVASNTSNDSSSTHQVRSTVSSSPRSPRQRHRSPRRHRSPAPTSPRRHHSSSHIANKSPPLSPRLEPDEYRAALREVRAELASLAERHEREVGELRAERDELRLRLDAAERRLRAFESGGATAVVAPAAADAAVRSPSRRTRHRASGGSRVARDPSYHVSTSSSSAEKQLSALERKPQQAPSLMRPASLSTSSSGDDAAAAGVAGQRGVVSAQMRKSQVGSSSSDDDEAPRAQQLRGESDSSESIVMHGASSARVTPLRPKHAEQQEQQQQQQQQQQQPGTMSTSTMGSVVLAGAEDVSLYENEENDEDDEDAQVEIVQPSGVEIVEASPTKAQQLQ
jgi:hypothetical protein